MSRAFVKDDDDRPERPAARLVSSDRPNYVTPGGMQGLRAALESASAAGDERNVEYYEGRIASAIVVEPAAQETAVVEFGSTVVAREEGGRQIRLRIVGEDEADPAHGTISWDSPYAQALLGHRAGERVVVRRPAGPATVIVEAIE